MTTESELCIRCGKSVWDHNPTYHYEGREVDGTTMRTPILDGHFYLPPVDDENDDE